MEKRVKKAILSAKSKDEVFEVALSLKNEFSQKLDIEIEDKIYLNGGNISKKEILVIDLDSKEVKESFQAQTFIGQIDIEIKNIFSFKAALTSYARAVGEFIHHHLKESPFEESITQIQNQIANEWNIALLIGNWHKNSKKDELFFFWRIKEVRDKLIKDFNLDIKPNFVYYSKKDKSFTNWCEYSTE